MGKHILHAEALSLASAAAKRTTISANSLLLPESFLLFQVFKITSHPVRCRSLSGVRELPEACERIQNDVSTFQNAEKQECVLGRIATQLLPWENAREETWMFSESFSESSTKSGGEQGKSLRRVLMAKTCEKSLFFRGIKNRNFVPVPTRAPRQITVLRVP